MGHNLFRGFATILIVWFGVQAALSSAEGGEGFSFARFSRLLLVVAFGFAMVTYYSTPIPGMGYSFSDLVIQEASSLSNSIGIEQGRLVETKVTEVEQGLEQPSAVNLHEILTFVVLYVILAAVQAVIFMVIGFGLIAQAVLLLVGPIFIPFLLFPKWTGSSGAGSKRSCNIRSIKSSPMRLCSSSPSCCWRSLRLIRAE
jgi:hypothetical protein